MKSKFAALLISIYLLGGLSCLASAADDDTMTFVGRIYENVCFAASHPCMCPPMWVVEQNDVFELMARNTLLDKTELAQFLDGAPHRVTGRFIDIPVGATEESCYLFDVIGIDDLSAETPNYDPATEKLHIPKLIVNGYGDFQAEIGPPFNVLDFQILGETTQ